MDFKFDHDRRIEIIENAPSLFIKIERLLKWRELAAHMPWFSLPPEYEIKMMPPFTMATIRFAVRLRENPDHECSIFFDAGGLLGAEDEPYWEVYPLGGNSGSWPQRFAMNDTEGLVQGIIAAIADSNKEPLQAVEFKLEDDDE